MKKLKWNESSSPFNATFGTMPEVFLGREDIVNELIRNYFNRDGLYRASVMSGIRGIGKTTLMKDVSDELSKYERWIVVEASLEENNDDVLVFIIEELIREAEKYKKSIIDNVSSISFSFLGLSIDFSREKEHSNLSKSTLIRIVDELNENNIGVLFTIDEVRITDGLRSFLSCYQLLMKKKYNVCLLLAGLPQNIDEILSDGSITFLRRAPKIFLGRLDIELIKLAYKKSFDGHGVVLTNEQIDEISYATHGYPYLFQLIGYNLWEKDKDKFTSQEIELIILESKIKLFINVHQKIFEETSSVDKLFLYAMSQDNKVSKIGDIKGRLNKSKATINNYKNRLTKVGLIEQVSHGEYRFTLPYMKEFLENKIKEDEY